MLDSGGIDDDASAPRAAQPHASSDSRPWFERLADATPDIIFVLDIVRRRNVYASRSLGNVLGYSREEFQQFEDILERVIPASDLESTSRFYAAMREAQQGEIREFSHRAIHKDGTTRWMENRVTPFSFDSDGRVVEVVGISSDVTARHEIEAERGRLANLIEHSSDFIAMADLDGSLTYMNAAGRRLIGLDPRRDLGSVKITDYVAPEALEHFGRVVIPTILREGHWQGEMQLMHLETGERIDVARSTYVIRDPNSGAPIGLGTVTRDIRQQKKAEEELRRSEELVRTIAENSTQGFAMMDERGYCTYANHAWLAMTGFTAEEIGSMPLHDLVHHHLPDGRPFPKDECAIDRALPENFDLRAHEDLFFRKDGTTFPVVVAASPIFKNGRPVSTVIEIRDVTEARRAETALRESEEQFRTLADNMSQLAWMADAGGSIFWYNRRWFEYTGTTIEDMRGWGWQQVHHPEHVDAVTARFRSAVARGDAWEDTFPLRSASGSYRWFLSRALPIRNANGDVVRWFGTNTDVTEIRETEEALRQADQLKDDFLATLSHELRTPLTAILGWAELLRGKAVDPDQFELALATIHRSARAQAEMIEDVLDVSRITSGRMRLERRMADPRAIVSAALATVAPAAEAKQTQLESVVDPALGEMYVDPDRLQQILWNLLSNAIKFSPPQSRVRLSVSREGQNAVIEVRDNGPGIAPEFLPYVFDRFRQADSSTRRAYGGLGIGLALVKEFAMLHGGSVGAESEPGSGAVFRVTLPIVVNGTSTTVAQAHVARVASTLHGVRALVVDDDADARLVVCTILQRHGAVTIQAAGTVEALRILQNESPSVIVTDIAMPSRDGFDLLEAVRSTVSKTVPVIALTAHPSADNDVHGRFDAYLSKPPDSNELAIAIARVVSRS